MAHRTMFSTDGTAFLAWPDQVLAAGREHPTIFSFTMDGPQAPFRLPSNPLPVIEGRTVSIPADLIFPFEND